MEFLGHQVGGDVITPSRDILEKVSNSRPDYQEADVNLFGPSRLLLGGTGECILPTQRVSAAGASVKASRLSEAVRATDRRIRSWGGGCATTRD